jgi:hypothetical protein
MALAVRFPLETPEKPQHSTASRDSRAKKPVIYPLTSPKRLVIIWAFVLFAGRATFVIPAGGQRQLDAG